MKSVKSSINKILANIRRSQSKNPLSIPLKRLSTSGEKYARIFLFLLFHKIANVRKFSFFSSLFFFSHFNRWVYLFHHQWFFAICVARRMAWHERKVILIRNFVTRDWNYTRDDEIQNDGEKFECFVELKLLLLI